MKINPKSDKVFFRLGEIKRLEGEPYCPCQPERTIDTICPCKDMRINQKCC